MTSFFAIKKHVLPIIYQQFSIVSQLLIIIFKNIFDLCLMLANFTQVTHFAATLPPQKIFHPPQKIKTASHRHFPKDHFKNSTGKKKDELFYWSRLVVRPASPKKILFFITKRLVIFKT